MNIKEFRMLFRQQLRKFDTDSPSSLSTDAQIKFATHLRSLCLTDPKTTLVNSNVGQKLKTGLKLHDLEIYFEQQGDGSTANIFRPNGGLTLPGYKIEVVGQMEKFEVSEIDGTAKAKTKKKIIQCLTFDALVRYLITLKKAASLIPKVKPKKIAKVKVHHTVHKKIAKIAHHVAKHKHRKI